MIFEGDLIRERARVTPDRVALVSVETGERLTYAAFDEWTAGAAEALRAAGVGPGDRYGILAHNSLEYLAFFFAAGRSGAIAVPLSTRATAHELSQIVDDCAMKALFHSDEFEAVARELSVVRCRLSVASTDNRRPSTDNPQDPERTFCLLYTSGTTGKPKGVMIPQRQLWWNGYNTAVNWALYEDDIGPVFTPMYHAGGLAVFTIPLFTVGGRVVVHRGFDVHEVWRTIERERCTLVFAVPTIFKMMMEAPEFSTVDLARVRAFMSGGAPLPAYIIEAYQRRGVVFKQGYGMTEVGVNCFTMTVEESRRKQGSIGRPMLFTEISLRDAEGREVKADEVGEMYIRGPHVSSGYWNNQPATQESYLPGGWFRTGDLARRDAEGFFYIAGRRKEMFISGGVNVYPAEIEGALVTHPAVADAAVVAVPDERWGEAAVAFVVAANTSGEELGAYLATKIAKYKVPRRFIFVDSLPRTPYGKVEKGKLRDQLS